MGNRGGARPGAGRKSDHYWQRVNELLGQTVLPSDWQSIIYSLVRRAREGDVRAARLLLNYHFGDTVTDAAADPLASAASAAAPHAEPPRVARGYRLKH